MHPLRRLAAVGLLAAAAVVALAQPAEGRKVALVVGVQRYSDGSGLRNLDYTEKDAADLAAVLEKQGYRVTILTRAEAVKQDKDFLRPTAKNIKAHLKAVTEDRKPADTVLVALTGHGAHLKTTDKLYFCPQETDLKDPATLVAIDDVMAMLDEKNCLAANKVLLVDACRNDPADGAGTGPPAEVKSLTRPLVPDPPGGTVALLSCSKGQISHESQTHKRGFLFHHVIEGLGGKAATKKGEVTWLSLANYVAEELPEAVKAEKGPLVRQTPEVLGRSRAMVLAKLDTDDTYTSQATGMKFVRIPKGTFTMGTPAGKEGRFADETPHEVVLTKDFYLGVTEVTQGQWKAVMGTAPWQGKSNVKEGDDYPATYVSWDDAVAFAKALSGKDGRAYRLPTEAEWEYACRGRATSRFHFGDGEAALGDYAWFTKDASDAGEKYAHRVATKKPNQFGLYDMHGNVWEWCSDWHGDYPAGRVTDPIGPASGAYRVFRGGSWDYTADHCRSASRNGYSPGYRVNYLGFRLALVPSGR